jgi:hypothetical protein
LRLGQRISGTRNVRAEQSEDAVSFNAGAVQVKILRTPLRVLFLNSEGKTNSEDQPGYPTSFNNSAFRVWKSKPEDEHYLAWATKRASLDHRNLSFTFV